MFLHATAVEKYPQTRGLLSLNVTCSLSTAVLTNRQYGVATIWLVATLGSKSSLKKITRRAILDVDLPKACQTITEPEAPLALRLQGSLLYGVSRVYSQQCGYILTDVTNLWDKMRGTAVTLRQMDLDLEVANTRPEQLNLAEDPAFIPDLDMNFDLTAFGFSSDDSSMASFLSPRTAASSQSSMFPGEDQNQEEEGEGEEGLDLVVPPYHTPGDGEIGRFQMFPGAGTSSAVQTGPVALSFDDEPIEDDGLIFDVDDNGVLRTVASGGYQLNEHPEVSGADHVQDRANVHGELANDPLGAAVVASSARGYVAPEDDGLLWGDDEENVHADASDAVSRQSNVTPTGSVNNPDPSFQPSDGPSITAAAAAAAPQQRARRIKSLQPDQFTELSNKDLKDWNENYLVNMQAALRIKQQQVSLGDARKYAGLWSVGQGLGRVAFAFANDNTPHPLAIFSGDSLWEMLRGIEPKTQSRTKRSHSQSEGTDQSEAGSRRVRARTPPPGDVGHGFLEDDGHIIFDDGDNGEINPSGDDDFNIESQVGRYAPPSLQDYSSGMPWNVSASRQSSAQALGSGVIARLSSSVGTGGGIPGGMDLAPLGPPSSALGRRGSRLTSASPLLGRGLSRLGSEDLIDPSRLTIDTGDDFAELDQQLGADIDVDFELYGPSAIVDTQLAQQSQWVTATLENEAYNFLSFVQAHLRNEVGVNGSEQGGEEEQDENGARRGVVTFSGLLPAEQNSRVVAAQGMLHVLALATKGLLDIYQEVAFGEIEMTVAGE
ncbi:hypothetical protein LTR84_001040 [Exophiala bonariae]|uniref:Rad21/Rec8-like protein N-terminal domain-containing protein n=1 Tax=Exophiala bonariae TaxID=1690606 RepID=A0AAV9NSP5_9EURO|nr:hypothetical protein LTR84_001040 [Exophiala bonariae]